MKGVSAALIAAGVGLLLVIAVAMTVWIGETRTSAPLGDVLRTGAAFWLLGHGARLHLPEGTAALIPLGLSVLFVALISRAGAKVARVRPAALRNRAVLGSALAVGVPYALTAALVAVIASGGGLHVSAGSAVLGAFVLAAPAAAIGAWRELPAPNAVPGPVRAVAAGVGAAAAALIAACAVIAGIALLVHVTDAAALAKPERAGAVGGMGLLVLQAALVPNAITWTGAYVLGPGFAVGAGTIVSPTHVHLGALPGLPMLAGLPGDAAPWPAYVLFVVPPVAGVLAGMTTLRRLPDPLRLRGAALCGLAIAGGVGLLAALAAAVSGGSVTSGRFETIGPSALPVGAVAALEVGVPALLTIVALTFYRTHWVHRPVPADGGTLGERARAVAGAARGALVRPFAGLGRMGRLGRKSAEADVIDVTDVDLTGVDLTGVDLVPVDDQVTEPLDLSGLAELVRQAEEAEALEPESEPEAEPEREPVEQTEAQEQPQRRRFLRLPRHKKAVSGELPD
jgi:hypothetical protein